MASGGARNRSGPQPDPRSARSESRGLSFAELPSEGFRGRIPPFPLPVRRVMVKAAGDGGSVFMVEDFGQTEWMSEREQAIWKDAWRTPQAAAWHLEKWRWQIVAEYCRLKTIVEADPSATAALVAQLHRYRDQLGLTPAGLKENGWAIRSDEVAAKRAARREEPAAASVPQRRLRAVQ